MCEDKPRRMPYITTTIEKSKDGKHVITKTTITHIRPVAYFEAIMDSDPLD